MRQCEIDQLNWDIVESDVSDGTSDYNGGDSGPIPSGFDNKQPLPGAGTNNNGGGCSQLASVDPSARTGGSGIFPGSSQPESSSVGGGLQSPSSEEDSSEDSDGTSSSSSNTSSRHGTGNRSVRGRGARRRGSSYSHRGSRGRASHAGSRGAVVGASRRRGHSRRGTGRGRSRGRSHGDENDRIDVSKWKKEESEAVSYPYTMTAGPTMRLDSDVTPGELFSTFFADDVWDLIVQETNRYAYANVGHTPHARPWEDVTTPEMKAFVGLLIAMGVLHFPRLEMYWQVTHPLLGTPGISSIMSRMRFEQIFRFLHLADSDQQIPAGQPGHDRLFKVRGLLDLVLPRFESNYTLHQAVSIDEAMIPFKGRLGFKQYIKNKPTKCGIKAFVLSDATNGYVFRTQIYTGKNAEDDSSAGLCTRVVLDLMSGLEDGGLDLFTGNYYTSPELHLTLYEKGINCLWHSPYQQKGFSQRPCTKGHKGRGKRIL